MSQGKGDIFYHLLNNFFLQLFYIVLCPSPTNNQNIYKNEAKMNLESLPKCVTSIMLSLRFLALNIMEKTIMRRLWEAATDLVNLNTWFSWQSSITPVDSLPLAVGKVQGRDMEDLNC